MPVGFVCDPCKEAAKGGRPHDGCKGNKNKTWCDCEQHRLDMPVGTVAA
jgi:hypothetical protein